MVDQKNRLSSLDVFRGLTIAGMILVNNPGSWSHVYAPLRHAEWHGWTPTDLIFPFFLFIVGVAMTFSLSGFSQPGVSRGPVYRKILRRTLIVFGLGLFLSGFPFYDLSTIRIPGVLQRIAICYLVASLITINTSARGQALWMVALLLAYWAAMALIPVPGYGAGNYAVDGNLAAFIDSQILHGHMWKATWDPEGLLSTIPAIATTLSGVLVGHLLHQKVDRGEIAGQLFVFGWGAILTGVIWAAVFPINKSLWTSSYVVFSTGAAMQFLGVCYWLIDVKGYRKWVYPGSVFGMNAIAVFVLSGIVGRLLVMIKVPGQMGTETAVKTWLYQNTFVPLAGPLNGSFLFALTNLSVWFGLMAILYRKKVFIKI